MRLELDLCSVNEKQHLPINYNYPLGQAVYEMMSNVPEVCKELLRQRGYLTTEGELCRLYTVSGLFLQPKPKPLGNMLPLVPLTRARLYISSPMIEESNQDKVVDCFSGQQINVTGGGHNALFNIQSVKVIPVPDFQSTTQFLCLSPMVFSQERGNGKQPFTYYFRPEDAGLPTAVRQSLICKYKLAYNAEPQHTRLDFKLRINPQQRRITRLIHIREGEPDEFFVRAIFTRFILSGSTELMRTAWECGIGEQCSLGFGCIGID